MFFVAVLCLGLLSAVHGAARHRKYAGVAKPYFQFGTDVLQTNGAEDAKELLEAEADLLTTIPSLRTGKSDTNDDLLEKDLESFESHALYALRHASKKQQQHHTDNLHSHLHAKRPSAANEIPLDVLLQVTRALSSSGSQINRSLEQNMANRFDVTMYEFDVAKKIFQLMAHMETLDKDPLVNAAQLAQAKVFRATFEKYAILLNDNFLPPMEAVGRALSQFADITSSPVITAQTYTDRVSAIMSAPKCDVADAAIEAAKIAAMSMNDDPNVKRSGNPMDVPISVCDFVKANLLAKNAIPSELLEIPSSVTRRKDPKCCRDVTQSSSECEGVPTSVLIENVKLKMQSLGVMLPESGANEMAKQIISTFMPKNFGGVAKDTEECLSSCEYKMMRGFLGIGAELQTTNPELLYCSFVPVMGKGMTFDRFLGMVKAATLTRELHQSSAPKSDAANQVLFPASRADADPKVRELFIALSGCKDDDLDTATISAESFKEYLTKLSSVKGATSTKRAAPRRDETEFAQARLHDLQAKFGTLPPTGLHFAQFQSMLLDTPPLTRVLEQSAVSTVAQGIKTDEAFEQLIGAIFEAEKKQQPIANFGLFLADYQRSHSCR